MIVSSISQSISDLLSNDALVSEHSFTNCTDSLIELISLYPNISSSDLSIHSVVKAFSSILGVNYVKHIPDLSQRISNSFDILLAARQSITLAGERASIITPNIRLLVQKGSVYEMTGINVLVPQAAEEIVSNQLPTIVEIDMFSSYHRLTYPLSIPVTSFETTKPALRYVLKKSDHLPAISSFIKNVTYGAYSTSINPGDIIWLSLLQTNVNYRKSSVNSSTIRVKTGFLSGDLSKVELVKVTLPNFDLVHYDSVRGRNGSYYCDTSDDVKPYKVLANCTSTPAWALTCPGNVTAVLTYVCPVRREVPQCLGWSSDSDKYTSTSNCSVTTYSAYNTTCECVGTTGYESPYNSMYDMSTVTNDLAIGKTTEFYGYSFSTYVVPGPPEKTKIYSVRIIFTTVSVHKFYAYGILYIY